MKNIFKGLVFGSLLAVLTVVTAVPAFAQQNCDDDADTRAAVYAKFTNNYKSDDVAKIQIAIDGAKEYIQKYASCDGEDQAIPNYLKKNYPKLEEKVAAISAAIKESDKNKALYGRFNKAVEANPVNVGEAFAAGKNILAEKPDSLDLILVLASIGFDEAAKTPPNNTYNNQAIDYAQSAIKMIESGTKSVTGDYGAYKWIYKNNDYADGKSNALGWMNYTIGYIMFVRQNKQDTALPYLYEATKYNSGVKENPFIYQTLGKFYLDKTKKLAEQYTAEVEANDQEETPEAKRLFGLQKAYAERAVDAYARAYTYAKAGTDKTYADGLYTTVKGLYTFRNDGKEDGLDGYIAGVANRPMPDPTTEVQPIIPTSEDADADPAATGTMEKEDSTMKKPASTTTTGKPDSTMKKPASTTTKTDSTMKKPASTTTKTDSTTKTNPTAVKPNSTTVTVKKDDKTTNGTTQPKKP